MKVSEYMRLNPDVVDGITFVHFAGRPYRVIAKQITKHQNAEYILLPMFSIEDEKAKDKYYSQANSNNRSIGRPTKQFKPIQP
jgi:hypothetical protein